MGLKSIWTKIQQQAPVEQDERAADVVTVADLAQYFLAELRAKRTEKRVVHPDGRWFRAEMGTTTWVPVDPKTNKWFSPKSLTKEGFELKDIEI